MKKNIIFSLFLLLTINASCQNEKSIDFLNKNPDEILKLLNTEHGVVGVSAGYAVNGKVLWLDATGYANKKTNQPFKTDTKVRMASIAKSMTAIAIMQLVEKKSIDLNVPIQTYISDYPKQANTQITIRHLLSHTSGIDGYKNVSEAQTKINYPTLTDAVNIFKHRPLLFEPGTQYSYSTYGYTVLGLIIEKASGLPYDAYMQKNIWDKVGMSNTGVDKYKIHKQNSSNLYQRTKRGKTKDSEENNLSNRIPGGGLYTTVEDMIKFGNAVVSNTLVKAETLEVMRQHHSLEKEENGYGFGWFLYNPKPNEGKIIGHNGAQTGCSSQLFIIPEKGIVAVVLSNTSRTTKEVTIFASKLMKTALDEL